MDFNAREDQQQKSKRSLAPRMSRDATAVRPTQQLTDEAIRLILELSGKASLQDIAIQCPGVLNTIAAAWTRPADAYAFFDEFLADEHGGPDTFSPLLRSEITKLGYFYTTQFGRGDATPSLPQ
jgi:hypothetical protein